MNARPDTAQAAPDAQLPAEFRSALQLAQAAVWDWQCAADRFQVDEAWLRAFGVEVGPDAIPVHEWQRRIHPDDLGAFNAATDSCQHGGDRFECEYRLLSAGHRWLWVLQRGRVVQRERDGAAARITGLLLDVDRRKSEEVARSDSESRLATALWGARAAFWQWHVPSNARTASPLWLAMTGYSRAQWDATPNPWFSNLHPEDRELVDRQLREHAHGERDSVEFEYRFKTAAGEYRWMQDRGRAVEWDLSGRPVLVIGVTLDIDAAKRAEAHLASSDQMLETAAWGAGIGLWETNFVTETTRWFNDWCDRHDIDPCLGPDHVQRWDANLHPEDVTEAARRFFEHVNGKAEFYDAEYRIRSRSGAWRCVFERGRVVERDAGGKAVRMLGVCMDLDENKIAERAANARNERVEKALQLTNAGVWDWDVENGVTNNTDGYYRVFGVDPSVGNANALNWRQLLGIDPDQAIDQFRRRLLRVDPNAPVLETEYRFRHTDGTWHWALDRAFVVERAPDGATRRVLGLVVDITERKLRETALSAADQRFRAIARELRCIVYEIDGATNSLVSEGLERVLGYPPGYRARASEWTALLHPEDQPLLKNWYDRQSDEMIALQYRIRHRDGHYVTLLDSSCAVRDASGKVVRIVGVAIDFSEQARAQEALRSSQELLQMVAAGTSDWLILVDEQRRVQFINRGIRSHSRESIIGKRLDEIAVPEDRQRIHDALTQVLTTGESVDLQLASSGAPYGGRCFDSRIRAVHSPGGISGAVVNITEITDRQAAQLLRETQARMFELLHEGVVVVDARNRIRMANPAFERMFGFAPGTAVDTPIDDLIAQAPGVRRDPPARPLLGEPAEGHGPTPLEFKCRRRDGSTFEAACVATPTHLDGVTHRLAVITDVTERRRLEREILEIAGREQLRIGSDLHDGLGQDLTGVALMLRSVVAQLRKENSTARSDVEDIISLVNGAIESTRAMARGLAPVGADRGGLIAGLQSMAVRGMERYGVRAHFNTSLREPLTLDDAAATHLYRIAQEAFTNAIRHGRVTQVSIDLATADGTLTLAVKDNGRGFDERNASNGMGMKLMRYRAQMLGGDISIVNNVGGGVTVRCSCPHRAPLGGELPPRGGFPLKD
ncbi:MAG TPA: PAS domain-containing protein [Steroidobacteraceae bacterium]|jgi:PAS domain S-box-containing protein|nr:PAS domain-containing protein [Steroidobacteraceae bacterium]